MLDAPEVIRLGTFDLDLTSGELTRSGRRIHLPAQTSRLLVLLARRGPEVVSREEIRLALWGEETHVEFDAAVNACISQIRSTLGDSARSPRFIQTVPRHGYRCLVEPGTGSREPFDSRSRDVVAQTLAQDRPMTRALASVTFVLAGAIGFLVWSVAPSARATSAPSLEAAQKYERGISGLADASPPELLQRVRYFETAITADPDFAEAVAGLAQAKLMIGAYRVESPQIAYAAAKVAAQKALTLDPSLADAHAAYGAAVLNFEWDWRRAEEHLRRAVSLDPRSARTQLWWSRYLTGAGRHDQAVAAARRAVALAPGSPSALTQLGIANYYAGRLPAARSACGEAASVMREFEPAQACTRAIDGGASPNLLLLPAIDLVRRGDREQAIDWLQRAANRRSDSLIFAGVEPALDPLRSDPRFDGVLKRVGRPMQ
jgi:DNA-binding winged helix-turn-helix (wHTH) protein/tetratricopeptide (TPR) repeat protein